MEYLTEDLVLSGLSLPDPCPVRIKTTDKYVYLFIGQRDWQWRLDGSFVGSGCGVCGELRDYDKMKQAVK